MKAPASEMQPDADRFRDAPRAWVSLTGGVIVEADDRLAALLGRQAADLAGQRLDGLFSPEERPAVQERMDEAVLLGTDQFGALSVPRPEGPPVWVDVQARFDYRSGERLEVRFLEVTRDEAGGASPAAAEAVPADSAQAARGRRPAHDEVTDLVLATLDATGAAVLFVGPDGKVGGATKAVERVLGRSAVEVRGLEPGSFLRLPEAAERALASAAAEGARQSVLAGIDDREDQVLLEWVPGGRPGTGYLALSASGRPSSGDTERIRLQAQLVAHVSHDLRGALAAVQSGLRALADDLAAGSDEQETAALSLAQVERARRIVEEVLALSRPGRLRKTNLPVDEVLAGLADRYRPQALEKGVTVDTRLAPGMLVSADRSNLEAAFGNLVENALRAMPAGGRLTLTLEPEERSSAGVLVCVGDTGVGIRPELGATVFEAFVSDSPGGSGLGLAIARHVVLAHGGQIDFDTEVGKGTTFRVWLPRLT